MRRNGRPSPLCRLPPCGDALVGRRPSGVCGASAASSWMVEPRRLPSPPPPRCVDELMDVQLSAREICGLKTPVPGGLNTPVPAGCGRAVKVVLEGG